MDETLDTVEDAAADEAVATPAAADASNDASADLQTQLEEANRRADAEHDAYLRALADFANYKRRAQEDAARQRDFGNEKLLTSLLPIVDNFERALQSAQATKDYDKLIDGVNAILRQMQDVLAKNGVEAIDATPGEAFDPNLHNAVLREETTEYPENAVVDELQKGYTLAGRVLRPSMVKVAAPTE
jgi:molecular chaperone GrpE